MTTDHQIYHDGWKALNKIEESMSDLIVFSRLLDMALDSLDNSNEDEVMNALIAAKQYIGFFEKTFDRNFRSSWDVIIPALRDKAIASKSYYAKFDDDGVLTLPPEVLEKEGWVEGTQLNVEVGEDGQSLVITKAPETEEDEESTGGCMGDELTTEELNALQEKGLSGLFKLPPPWRYDQ